MLQLTREGLVCSGQIERLTHAFEQTHVLRLPQLLHADLMRMIAPRLEHCTWTAQCHGTIAREAVPDAPAPANILNFVANTPEFIELARRITQCSEISWFSGRVYRMVAAGGHYDSWHADLGTAHRDRLVGMSINLGLHPYQGGVFRLRDETSGEILCELPNTGAGDAILFRISPALRHMVTAISGTEPKTAFAGWFRSGESSYYSMLRAPIFPALSPGAERPHTGEQCIR